jgi:hypothetical protein
MAASPRSIREYQSDQPSRQPLRPPPGPPHMHRREVLPLGGVAARLDRSLHIRRRRRWLLHGAPKWLRHKRVFAAAKVAVTRGEAAAGFARSGGGLRHTPPPAGLVALPVHHGGRRSAPWHLLQVARDLDLSESSALESETAPIGGVHPGRGGVCACAQPTGRSGRNRPESGGAKQGRSQRPCAADRTGSPAALARCLARPERP